MKTAEFLSVYPRDLTRDQIHHGATGPEVMASQIYSYSYGQLLYDALSGSRQDLPERLAQLREYEEGIDIKTLEMEVLDEEDWRSLNEINFQQLNHHMEKMWDPIVGKRWPGMQERHYAANFSMNGLALGALRYYTVRERFITEYGADALYSGSSANHVGRITGVMQEYDATIATLQWAKKHKEGDITVVPAPAQFEHSARKSNADLLVIDLENDRMTGVQIKTQASMETRRGYDQDRIVVIDCEDLENVRVLPAKGAKKGQTQKPWPGIIAASRVAAIDTRHNPDIHPNFYPYLRRRKMEAVEQLGKLRINYDEVSKKIGQKILEKL